MSETRDITVTIFGKHYTLRSDADPKAVEQLALDVDSRMREAASAGGAAGADRIAVLAALNLAEELNRERQARREEHTAVETQTGRIIEVLQDGVGNRGVEGVS